MENEQIVLLIALLLPKQESPEKTSLSCVTEEERKFASSVQIRSLTLITRIFPASERTFPSVLRSFPAELPAPAQCTRDSLLSL